MITDTQPAAISSRHVAVSKPVDIATDPVVIMFLDFDGVISTHRAYTANRGMTDRRRWIDEVATSMLMALHDRFPFKIVVSSTWRSFGQSTCSSALWLSGLSKHMHDDWCTNQSHDGQRPTEIDEWLSRNNVIDFVILDDDNFAWTGKQLSRLAKCDPFNGLTWEAFCRLENLLKEIYSDVVA